ncbi:hypothetical protein PINS_up024219 [Pythium insidiosum]|nr:hypothetical protein PINS_up024219 [Pythium insidiosum]
MYSIAMTVRIVFTFGILTVAWNWYFPTLLVVILAILNDGTILTISKDNVKASPLPDSWKLKQVFVASICFGIWLTISTVVMFYVVNNTDGFSGAGVENLCVDCMRDHCDNFMQKEFQACAKLGGSASCGEIDGSVMRSANGSLATIGAFRKSSVDKYWEAYSSKYDHTMKELFDDLSDIHVNDLPNDAKPSAMEAYEQFMFQYTVQQSGKGFAGDYNVFESAQDGNGVEFVGNDRVPVTNEVAFCDYVWSFSNFNKTWTKNYLAIGPGRQRKEGCAPLARLHAGLDLGSGSDLRHAYGRYQQLVLR